MTLSVYSVKRTYPVLLLGCSSLGFSIMLGLGETGHGEDWVVMLWVQEARAELLVHTDLSFPLN